MEKKILTSTFFARPTVVVAQELLGKYLVRRMHGKEVAVMITETEAYDGFEDTASHASKGKTPRTEVMFGTPGHWYVYLCYGVHEMLNVVTGPKGYPAAVLIRAVAETQTAKITKNLTSKNVMIYHNIFTGPGRVTKKLMIDRLLNTKQASRANGLWIEDRGVTVSKNKIKKMPRVGVAYAGPYWAGKKWRFKI